jgi:hypothetical protein
MRIGSDGKENKPITIILIDEKPTVICLGGE